MDKRTLQKIRVPLGFIFAALLLDFRLPTVTSLVAGSVIALFGILIRAWAAGHIRKGAELAVTGPYAYTRNPLYLGNLLLGIGFTVAGGVWWLAVLTALLFVGIYIPVFRVEADDMRRAFQLEYEAYAAAVPVFVPRVVPWRGGTKSWDLGLYLQCREYRVILGCVGVLIVLATKNFLLELVK